MTEKEFIKYYRNRNHLKNVKEAKEKIRFKAGKGLRNVINGADVDE